MIKAKNFPPKASIALKDLNNYLDKLIKKQNELKDPNNPVLISEILEDLTVLKSSQPENKDDIFDIMTKLSCITYFQKEPHKVFGNFFFY